MAHTASHDIIIIGRNIAGLGAAYALGKAGYSSLIIGPETRLYGGFQLAPNGFSALEALGLRQNIDAGALAVNAIQLKSLERAETLAEISHDDTLPYAGISRQHILDCLLAAVKNLPVTMMDSHLKALDLGRGSAQNRLLLETGDIISAPLLVGADGPAGLCRSAITGYQPEQAASDYLAMRAEIPASTLAKSFSNPVCQLWLGSGSHFVCYPFTHQGQSLVNAVYCMKRSALSSGASEAIQRIFSRHPVLSSFADNNIIWQETDLPDCESLPVWQRGGLTLIGDAAHQMPPHLAQGAGQVFEDIACLSECLTQAPPEQALRDMARIRSHDVTAIMQKARQSGSVMRLDGLSARMRNNFIKMAGGGFVEDWLRSVWYGPKR